MKHLQLQPRLRLLADMVPAGAHLADIGTDHGYLPVWLMQQGRITSAIAADIGPEPLAHARRTAAEYGAALDLRLCDGLRGIAPHEADTLVMAGMGGETIIQILTDSPWPRTSGCTLLLQPQTKVELLRGWLRENGYLIKQKGSSYNMPTQKSMELGLFKIKETCVTHSDGHTSINRTPKVTGKGQVYLLNKILKRQCKQTEIAE